MTSISQILVDIRITENHLERLNDMLYEAEFPGRLAYEYTQRGLENRFTRDWNQLSRSEKDTWITLANEAPCNKE